MNNKAFLVLLVAISVVPENGWAQKMELPRNFDVGDRGVHNLVSNGKTLRMEDEIVAVTDSEIQIRSKIGERFFEIVLSKDNFTLSKFPCLSVLQQCTFTPAMNVFAFPLEKGKKWSGTTTVEGETFTSVVKYDRNVEGVEKIRVPAGQFEAFRVYQSATIKGNDNKGYSFTGKENLTDWVALVNGKFVSVKVEYKNTFGEKFSKELISISFK